MWLYEWIDSFLFLFKYIFVHFLRKKVLVCILYLFHYLYLGSISYVSYFLLYIFNEHCCSETNANNCISVIVVHKAIENLKPDLLYLKSFCYLILTIIEVVFFCIRSNLLWLCPQISKVSCLGVVLLSKPVPCSGKAEPREEGRPIPLRATSRAPARQISTATAATAAPNTTRLPG